MTREWKRILKFLASGLSAAAAEYLIFILLRMVLGDGLLVVCQSASFMCGFLVSFYLNRKWVFDSDGNRNKQLVSSLVLACINIVASSAIILLLVEHVNIDPRIAKVIVMGMVAAWNYIIYKSLIFKSKTDSV